ncbi:DUF6336 family protein [Streptomyces siamensis]|uniref:DUF6336 family protein n=1 Tax=Streptomyces siamensis TaxID=1274986 RepID=UPI003CD0705C
MAPGRGQAVRPRPRASLAAPGAGEPCRLRPRASRAAPGAGEPCGSGRGRAVGSGRGPALHRFWAVCAGGIRRCRDRRTLTGQHSAPTVVAPVRVRLGVLGLVAATAAIGPYRPAGRAPCGSRLHGH